MTLNVNDIDLSDIEFWGRPPVERDAAFAVLRREVVLPFYAEPVQEPAFIEPGPGYWAVLRHADIETVSRQPDVFSSAAGATNIFDLPPEFLEYFGSMINMDDPRHLRLRRIVARAFSHRMVARIEEDIALVARSVVTDLAEHGPVRWARAWSPEQIARRLPIDFPDDETMRISHEAIYQALFVQGRGALRRELSACLRTGRVLRVPRARVRRRGKSFISPEIMISQRPAEAADRAVPGHWEGDLILGLGSSAIGTLVERTTRFTMLLHLPRLAGHGEAPRMKNGPALAGHGAEAVRDAITRTIITLPEEMRRSLTWDQGAEMAQHDRLKIDAGVQVYFCDPQSPWQRGTNENTNGLLRQYFPKGTDLSVHSADEIAAVASSPPSISTSTFSSLTARRLAKVWASEWSDVYVRSWQAERRNKRERALQNTALRRYATKPMGGHTRPAAQPRERGYAMTDNQHFQIGAERYHNKTRGQFVARPRTQPSCRSEP